MTSDRKPSRSRPNEAVPTIGDIESFALNGYVVMRGVLDERLLERAEDLMWEALGKNFDRDDSLTWRSVATDCAGAIAVSDRYGKVKLREAVWGEPALDALLTRNPVVFAMVERLLGAGNVLPPERSRGLYPTFPTPEHAKVPIHAHVDLPRLPFKVGVVAYLDDVPSGGGGFAVWPGSHRALFSACADDPSSPANRRRRAFRKAIRDFDAHEPVEITGGAGDVILFHHLLMHAPTINTVEGHVRKAAFCNYATPSCAIDQAGRRPSSLWHGWHGIDSLASLAIEASKTPAPADTFARPRTIPARAAYVDQIWRGVRKLSLGLKFRRILPEWKRVPSKASDAARR